KAAELIRAHEGDWARFFAEDEKGRKLPAYIATLAAAADQERADLLEELAHLQKNIDHVKAVVSRQQAQAKTAIGVVESVTLPDLSADAIKLARGSHDKRGIEVVRDYGYAPTVRLDRHKLFEIVMNLLSNAGHALDEQEPARPRRITVRLRAGGDARFTV